MYTPSNTMAFGKNKGYLLEEVYKFDPQYIDWLIINIENFYINVEDFYKLPKPTPKGYDRVRISKEQEKFNAEILGYSGIDVYKKENDFPNLLKRYAAENPNDFVEGSIGYSKMLFEKGIIMLEKDFKFSDKALKENDRKLKNRRGAYINNLDNSAEYGSTYDEYNGYNDYSDDVIDDAFEGDPSATWNVD